MCIHSARFVYVIMKYDGFKVFTSQFSDAKQQPEKKNRQVNNSFLYFWMKQCDCRLHINRYTHTPNPGPLDDLLTTLLRCIVEAPRREQKKSTRLSFKDKLLMAEALHQLRLVVYPMSHQWTDLTSTHWHIEFNDVTSMGQIPPHPSGYSERCDTNIYNALAIC